jgi:hypothetical protein
MSQLMTFTCTECGQPLYIGQPMASRGREYRAHVGCSVLAGITSQYGNESLRREETLPPLLHRQAA